MHDYPLDFIKPRETIILGLLDNNEEISLFRCSGQIKNFEFVRGRANLSFNAEYIFRKIHFENEQDINFKSISVQYSHLKEWIGKSGIQASLVPHENKLLISYQPPANIHLLRISELDLDITFSQIYVNPLDFCIGNVYYKASVEQKTYLTIKNTSNQPLDACINLLINFRDLLSFAMTRATSVTEVRHPRQSRWLNECDRPKDGRLPKGAC